MQNAEFFIQIAREALLITVMLTALPVMAALAVGLMISILQATTQLQEQTLTFVPKLFIIGAVLFFAGPDMLEQLIIFATSLFERFPYAVQ